MSKIEFSNQELIEIVERASTIYERIKDNFIVIEPEKDAIINFRIEQWCQVVAQGDWEKFERRLAWDELDLSTVRPLLGSVCFKDKQLPNWAETLNECVKNAVVETDEQKNLEKINFVAASNLYPFEEIWLSFVKLARQKLRDRSGNNYALLTESAHINLEHSLIRWLSYICSPSMGLEFSAFRASRQSTLARFQGKRSGEPSNTLYQNFILKLLEGDLLAFFREYPVLARLVATIVDLWIDAASEFISRLASDLAEIQQIQPESELGQIVEIKAFLSDRHLNGRSVTGVKFASGLKLIYKPKDIGIEQAYFEFLSWLNDRDVPISFKLIKVINRSNYGWVEFVEASPCQDIEATKRYYKRCGVLLCLVYVLEAIDLHFENIIACGEYPVLIDLETLMHPQVHTVDAGDEINNAQYLANLQLEYSVLSTGLLPRWQFDAQNHSFDFSGLGGIEQQQTYFKVQKWENINTDNMRLVYDYEIIKELPNDPSQQNVNLALNDYLAEVVEGFYQMYRFLSEHRDEILSPNGALSYFANRSLRFVFRSTKIYSSILDLTLDPKFLRDGADRSIELDILSRAMLLSSTKPAFWQLLRREKEVLEKMDIPLFIARSDSVGLTIASNETIEKCFRETSYDRVVSRIKKLNNQDLEQQINLIQGAFYSRIVEQAHYSAEILNSSFNFAQVEPLTGEKIVQQGIAIAQSLQKRAIRSSDGSATWIAPQYILEVKRFQLQPMSYSLYDGVCGIALFLAALEKVTNGAGFRALALGAVQSLCEDLQAITTKANNQPLKLGGVTGAGSIIYSFVKIGEFLEQPMLIELAQKIADLIIPSIGNDEIYDIVSGAAGTILGLLVLYNNTGDEAVLQRAIALGNHLLDSRVTSDAGYKSWSLDGKLLTGFSHGAAGIAYALLRLYDVTKNHNLLEAVEDAIAYENSLFNPNAGNWPDLREFNPKNSLSYMNSWCHGATGIGLARVAGIHILDTPEIRQNIEVAIKTTKQHNLVNLDHLCCGNLGRIEFLFTCGQKLSRYELIETAMEQAARIVNYAEQTGKFNYGFSLDYHPGFFQGAAGIGYELLRLGYPDLLPSVLLLE